MNTFGVIFLILTILAIIIPTFIAIYKRNGIFMLFSLFSLFFLMFFGVTNWPNPTDSDVKNGKAIYIENHQVGLNEQGDTIYNYKTYKKEWLPEWKYGRKH